MSNNVTVVGNLTADPELRFTASGVAMLNISVADSRRYQDRNGDWQEDTSFFRGTLWRDIAENAAETLTKGARVIIVGRLKQRTWETNEGEKRSVVELDIQEIGPSLRWATASVVRTPKKEGGAYTAPAPATKAADTAGDDPFAPVEGGSDDAPF